jgi:ABC-type Fe3+/spermidine/putrescine transport system ATPase subunit
MSLAERRRVAMVFQDPLLLSRSVLDNVAYGLRIRGHDRTEAGARALSMLRRFGVEHLAARRVGGLSGGEGQRIALARAVVLRPELLLLDEPMGSLDAGTRTQLTCELGALPREERLTCVYVTHDREEAQAMGHRVAVLDDGRVLQVAPSEEVFLRPGTRRVAELVGMGNVLAGTVVAAADGSGATLTVGAHRLAWTLQTPHGPVTVCARPEEVALHRAADGCASRLTATVVALRPIGAMVEVSLDCGFPLVAVVSRHTVADLELMPGATVDAAIAQASIHLIPAPIR